MKREMLKELGVAEDVIDKIMAENGKDIESEKAKVTAKDTELKNLGTQLADANKQIESFKGMDVEGIKKAADEWKTKYETAKSDAEKELGALKLDTAVERALTAAKTKNPKLAKAALDMSVIKLDGENILGLSEQLTKLKETDAYLFDEAAGGQQTTTITTGSSGGTHQPGGTPDYDKMTDDEYYKAVAAVKK